ncbi:BadF/BadG/BcrA/BcrD ATPase family protein [Oharaeibacter diazotrophicus]|uniref:Glucosamine kinase n=2 Tax=Oharaeibacter diazotrophicus TaxID=1920512 RepID=A0A4R6RAV3_9HYPH|nr:BadF/BadG/BcrA/BcrD ATPase family protein [Oharaeibacter diazotrophicus]TDP82756.1 glucosamine kinase [Oharaeibacter diazotrophicus]BBE72482.1 glucosamine kinase GspK [Pleomorphomonas sp. SM30]GLS76513.1 N-acetylglucosamine kinase [Oharaeibacter diazotrophicus]
MPTNGPLFLGIDGGGTTCRARLADAAGRRLGEGAGGPSNITTDLPRAAASILEAARAALAAAGLDDGAFGRIRAGFGMAGGNAPREAAALAAWSFGFAAQTVASDADVACLGAHGGRDGGILILGTGSQGAALVAGRSVTVGGWGFALSDGGSGAILGRAAARRALTGHEEIEPASAFTRAVMARFEASPPRMLAWALKAIPRDWAELAPPVFEHAAAGDPVASALLADHVDEVAALLDRLVELGAGRIALMGGLAAPTRPHLPARFDAVLVEPDGDALDGALALAGLGSAR